MEDNEFSSLINNTPSIENLKISFYIGNLNSALNDISYYLKNLKILDISYNENLNDNNIKYISNRNLPKLNIITLKNNTNITDVGFEILFRQCPQLKEIDLGLSIETRGDFITDNDLETRFNNYVQATDELVEILGKPVETTSKIHG